MSHRFSVCVYCGARDGTLPAYAAAAEELGQQIAGRGWRLVYGAGDVGLMGRVATAAHRAGGETLGVIPSHLLAREVGRRDLTTMIVTETMHERKKVMFMNANAVVALPGGAGTLDEVLEVLTWRQLGLHAKPILLVDTEGYWAPLVSLIDHVVGHGFAGEDLRAMLTRVDGVGEAVATLAAMAGG